MLCPIRPIPTPGEPVQGEIRRASWRDAAQVALLLACAHQRTSDRHPDSLTWYVRPPLIRTLVLWIAGVAMAMATETWITGAPSACLAIRRTGRPWRFSASGLACMAVMGAALGIVEMPVHDALHALLPPLVAELVFGAPPLILIGYMLTYVTVELVRNPLRKARQRVRHALPEPVWQVDMLASIESGAGRALGQALAAMADAEAATLLAETDGHARVRLYRAAGFTQVAWSTRPWGHAAILVRVPQPQNPPEQANLAKVEAQPVAPVPSVSTTTVSRPVLASATPPC